MAKPTEGPKPQATPGAKDVKAEKKAALEVEKSRVATLAKKRDALKAGQYTVTARGACTSKILGKFERGEARKIKLSAPQAAEFSGPHQPFDLELVKDA